MNEATQMRSQPTPSRGAGDTQVRLSVVARTHHWMVTTGFYSVAACSVLAIAALFARRYWSGEREFFFLRWNLFLAWVPWAFALPFVSTRTRGWWSTPLFLAWLFFLPNAPYLVTDLIHVYPTPEAPMWFDTTMLFLFAWTGCLLGFLSLKVMHAWVEARVGFWRGWLFVAAVAVLTGLGIYLGRFRRWNSWDLLTRPDTILVDTWRHLVHPELMARTWVVTLMFAAFFLAAYAALASGRRALRATQRA